MLICNSYTFKVFIINKHGQVLKKYDLMGQYELGQLLAVPLSSTERPIYVKDNHVYLMGTLNDNSIEDQTNSKMVIILNLANGEVRHSFHKSDVYNLGHWGINFLLTNLYGTYNPNTGHFIYSFSADPFIYETDHLGFSKKHYAGSQYFKEILPMDPDRKRKFSNADSKVFDFTSPAFYKMVYDPYKKLYYRSSFLPITKEEYQDPRIRYNRQETIIILDESFKKVGEYKMPIGKLAFYSFFVTSKGFHIQLKPELHQTEDSITYWVFDISKL